MLTMLTAGLVNALDEVLAEIESVAIGFGAVTVANSEIYLCVGCYIFEKCS